MNEPRIQYAKTSDGVSIAYSTRSEGIMALVQTPPIPFSQVQLASNMPEDRRWWDFMAGNIKLVRYDARGTGLSDRDVTDFSPDAFVSDLEAVAEHAKLDRLALWAFITSGPPAIAYAARHPERVSHLILWSTWARTADVLRLSQAQGLLALIDTDWELFTEAAAHSFFGWSAGELAHRAALHLQEGITQDTWKAMIQALAASDVTELLAQVRAPTLVLHSREAPLPDISVARELASRIPNARLVLLEGNVAGWEVPNEAITALRDFLGIVAPDASPASSPPSSSGTAVILFADIADSTALTERLGDNAFRAKARELDDALRAAILEHAGTAIEGKLLGDGVLAVFTSAHQAIECAQACHAAANAAGLQLHAGIHAGDVIRENDNVYGGAVNIASRIADAAAPGEVLVSDIVRGLARTSADVTFEDRGEHELKGIAEPQRLWAVRKGA